MRQHDYLNKISGIDLMNRIFFEKKSGELESMLK
jgi:hypothetical protein